jgi:hypothetical protein
MSGDHHHEVVLVALLYLPVVVLACLVALDAAARAGSSTAVRFQSACVGTTPVVLLASLGMLISATLHLVLAGTHVLDDPILAGLFALDGLALLAVVLWSLTRPFRGWRPAAVGVLAAGVLAYVVYLAAGQETLDPVGGATKVVELAAIGLLVLPSRGGARRSSRLLVPCKPTGGLVR